MKRRLLLVLLLAFSMLFLGNAGCEPPEPPPVDQFNPDLEYGEMTDPRDGQQYKIVVIGTQTWMAENLNYTPNTGNSWCYDDDPAACKMYGRLYDWETALNVCPSGWHLPSDVEWTILTTYLGDNAGGKMKSTKDWDAPNTDATNESGFSGLPGGRRYDYYGGLFYDLGSYGYWWSASESSADNAWRRRLGYRGGYVGRGSGYKEGGFSVRCLRN